MSDELVDAAKLELQALRTAVERRVAAVTHARAELDELVESMGVGVLVVDRSGRVLASDGVTPAELCDVVAEAVVHDSFVRTEGTTVVTDRWRLEFHPLANEPEAVGVVIMAADSAAAKVQGA